jgi:putative ABC transport system ATP-binding protein
MSGDAIRLEGVTMRYGEGAGAMTALRGVDLGVPVGEFLSITGTSGAGKSTLLSLVAGLDVPSSGRVSVLGRNLAELTDDERSDLRLQHVGFIFQAFNLFPTFTALENVAWPLGFLRVKAAEARERAAEMLERVAVSRDHHGRLPGELSGGEQQRIAIARALVTDPQFLLADEPTGNLDSRTGQAILDLLLRLNSDRHLTVLLVTHNRVAATYGHRTIELRDGSIVRETRADGPRVGQPRLQR